MGRHDVAHIAWAEAQIRDLPERRLGDVEPWPHHRVEQESEPTRLVDILDSKPGVDQDQVRSSPSIRRQWQHMGAGDSGPPAPPNNLPPRGQSDPQLR